LAIYVANVKISTYGGVQKTLDFSENPWRIEYNKTPLSWKNYGR
jgi:hypothetical protein